MARAASKPPYACYIDRLLSNGDSLAQLGLLAISAVGRCSVAACPAPPTNQVLCPLYGLCTTGAAVHHG